VADQIAALENASPENDGLENGRPNRIIIGWHASMHFPALRFSPLFSTCCIVLVLHFQCHPPPPPGKSVAAAAEVTETIARQWCT